MFLLLFWIPIMLIFKSLENSLVYPAMKASDDWCEPSDPATQEVWLSMKDGTKIHAWHLPCEGGMSAILRDTFRRSVLIYDYPGYGKSEGMPKAAKDKMPWLQC